MNRLDWKKLPITSHESEDEFQDRISGMIALRFARLCHDCYAIHDMEYCPLCSSVAWTEIHPGEENDAKKIQQNADKRC
jgi:hypothetical protein